MEQISKRKSLSLSDFGLNGVFQAAMSVKDVSLDFACFGLDMDGKLSDERYMTFFNQPESPCGGIQLCQLMNDTAGFSFKLNQLPESIERIVIAVSIEGNKDMSQLQSGYLSLISWDKEFTRFPFQGSDLADKKTVILAEIYRKNVRWPAGRSWHVSAVMQGFLGGLDALVQHFGGSVVPDTAAADVLPSGVIPPEIVDFLGLSIGTHTDAYLRQLALFAAQHTQVKRHADRLEAMLEKLQGWGPINSHK